VELDDTAIPDITVSFGLDEDNDDKVGYAHGTGKAKEQEDIHRKQFMDTHYS
jgi:hypothetical protein